MLYLLLTWLPFLVSPVELEYHTLFILSAYQRYYENMTSTGLRDREALTTLRRKVSYSMSIFIVESTYILV